MKITFVIEGGKELDANLMTLGKRVHDKVIRRSVREGQKPMLDACKRSALSIVGGEMGSLLAKTLVIKTPRKQYPGKYSLNVQHISISAARKRKRKITIKQSGGKKLTVSGLWYTSKSGRKTYIPAAIEYGHMSGGTFVPPMPYMRQAAEATQNESMRIFADELRKGLLREAIVARSR